MSEMQTKDVVPTMVTLNEGTQLPATRETLGHNEPSAPPAIIPEQTVKNIAIAVAKITAGVGVIPKRGHNRFHNYKYVLMQDVMERLQILLPKHGLTILPTELKRSMFDSDRTIAVEYGFTLIHTSGEMWPVQLKQTGMSRCRDSRGGFDDKAFNKANTAARKYFYLALFNVAVGDEDDADEDANRLPPSRPIPSYAKGSAIADGELMEDEIPDYDSPSVRNVVTANEAGAPQSNKEPQRGAPAETQAERLGRLRNRLAIAAESGTPELKKMWKTIDPADQRALESDLRSIYQPRANDIDAAQSL